MFGISGASAVRAGFQAIAACAALAVPVAATAAAATMVPNKGALISEQPTGAAPAGSPRASCSATGTYNEGGAPLGSGSWTKTAKTCKAPGTWTDSFSYTWALTKTGRGKLGGTVTYHGIPGCTYDTWPVTGKTKGKNFSVTATNPASPSDSCATYFGYKLTIQ